MFRSAGGPGDEMLSAINYSENEILHDTTFDVGGNLGHLEDGILSGISNPSRLGENPGEQFRLFEGEGDALMDDLSPLIVDHSGLGVAVSESGDSNISGNIQFL